MPNTLRPQIMEEMKTAMRAHDASTLNTLRYLLSLVKNVEIDAKHELDDAELVSVVQKEVKKRRENITLLTSLKQDAQVADEEQGLQVLLKFLPKQLSAQEIEAKVKEIVAASASKEFPVVIKEVMAQLKGLGDGKMISEIVKSALQ